MNKTIGVFIPARLASERLPNKQILPLGDSCMFEMACRKLSKLPDKYNKYALVYDTQLIEIARKYPKIKVIERDEDTAMVDTPLSYIFKDMKSVPDTHLMFLNPCLTFLKHETVVRALEKFELEDMDYATSVKPLKNWLFNPDGTSMNYIDYKTLTTKDVMPVYQAGHCFHIFNKEQFFNDGMMLKKGHGIIEIENQEELIDIDTFDDYEFAKWKHSKKYVVDIDGTICETSGTDYIDSKPINETIERLNRLHDAGNIIWYQSARGYVTGIDWRSVTEKQFSEWGVKYDRLLFGKPNADYYIDDKAINIKDW